MPAPSRRRRLNRIRRTNYRVNPPIDAGAQTRVAPNGSGASPSPTPAIAGNAAKINELTEQVKQFEAEREQAKEAQLRARAEMDNFRKRMQREKEEHERRAGENVFLEMLPALDNFERAMSASAQSSDMETVIKGIQMIYEQLKSSLVSQGLEPVSSQGLPFDPTLHEAVTVEERADMEANHVATELQRGYKLRGKLLRPARVTVSKKP